MTRTQRWTVGVAGTLGGLAVVAALALAWWLPSDAELSARITQGFEQKTGIALRIGRLHWTMLPSPRITLEDVATGQTPPITVRRAWAEAPWRALLSRRLRVDQVEVEGVVAPRESFRAFRGTEAASSTTDALGGMGAWKLDDVPVGEVRFSDITWSDRRGIALAYEGSIVFDPLWRPRTAELRRAEATPPVRLRLEREGEADRWKTLIDAGGGTWNGTSTLGASKDGHLLLTAELAPSGVDIVALMQTFGRSTPVAGTLNGRTEVRAEGDTPAELWRSLHTRTRFTVKPATLTRFDLARAVTTAGTSRGGTTPLDELTGTLDTQTTDDGMRLDYTGLKARSGLLSATGSARIVNRKLDGEAAVDLVDGVVGVPFKLGGTLDEPVLSLTGGALAGATVGTAVLPGVGTAIGARIGQQIERLFTDKEGAKRAAPKRPRP